MEGWDWREMGGGIYQVFWRCFRLFRLHCFTYT